METERRHIVFDGYVQGVGFRWRALHAAQRFSVTGWVRNCSDGTVEMEAEGTPADLDALMRLLQEYDWGCVTDVRCRRIPTEDSRSFEIR